MYERGDIVLNFRRYKAYVFNPDIEWQRKEQSYCRLATLSEQAKIKKVMRKKKVEVISFSDFGMHAAFFKRWNFRDRIKEPIYLERWQIYRFHKIMKEQNYKSYTEVINYLLGLSSRPRKEEKNLEKSKELLKRLEFIVSELKKELFNIILLFFISELFTGVLVLNFIIIKNYQFVFGLVISL